MLSTAHGLSVKPPPPHILSLQVLSVNEVPTLPLEREALGCEALPSSEVAWPCPDCNPLGDMRVLHRKAAGMDCISKSITEGSVAQALSLQSAKRVGGRRGQY